MEIKIDSKERIARSNVYSIFGKFLSRQISNNDDGKVILKKSGVSSFVDDYDNRLNPYWYNQGYRNDNDSYNPEYACMKICEALEEKEDVLLMFLNTILKGIREIDDNVRERLVNYLGVIGYELKTEQKDDYYDEYYIYTLIPSTDGSQERNEDISFLRDMLLNYHSDLIHIYDEAISNFGNGQYVSCIENCRSLFESFFKKLDAINADYVKGILSATGENVIDSNGANLTSIKKIYTYWIENKRGANRFRLFQTLYSVMSGLGTHCEDSASKEDALLILRYVEDCLLWCFRKQIN